VCLAAAAVLFLSRGRLRARAATATAAPPRLNATLLALHVLSFAAFWWTTTKLFGRPEPPAWPGLWVAVWALLAGAVPWLLIAGAIRPDALGSLRSPGFIGFLALVGLTAWLAGTWTLSLWDAFSRATLLLVARLLETVTAGVSAEPDDLALYVHDFGVRVTSVCSGYEGLGLMGVLVTAYLFAFRAHLRFPRALLLLPLGLSLVWCSNVLRIAALMLVGAFVDADLAYGAFHSKAGWVLFCAIALSVIALGHRSHFFARLPSQPRDELENPSAAYLLPLVALLGTALVTSMFAAEVDAAYGVRLVAAALVLYAFRNQYRSFTRAVSWYAPVSGAALALVWIIGAHLPWFSTPGASRGAPAATASWAPWAYSVWLSLRVLGAVVVVPIVEELAFRGYLLRRLIARDFDLVSFRRWTPLAFVVSSLAFGLLHERWLLASACGATYGLLQIKSGRLSDAVVAHATTNALITIWALASGDWSVWG
jgi:exosortase E/protease (VPEID-CTERM system)